MKINQIKFVNLFFLFCVLKTFVLTRKYIYGQGKLDLNGTTKYRIWIIFTIPDSVKYFTSPCESHLSLKNQIQFFFRVPIYMI